MKKLSLILLVTCILATSLYAGGQQEAEVDTSAQFNIEAPLVETDIDIIGWTFPLTDFYKEEFQKLEAIDNLNINIQFLNNTGAQEQVRLALSGGKKSPYEIVHASNSQISEWGYAGWLMSLDGLVEKYWDEYDLGDIPTTAWEAATADGHIVGIPMSSNSFVMCYRQDLFEKHGLSIPKTYDELLKTAMTLKEKEPSIDISYMINLHAGWAWEIEFLHALGGYGASYLNEDNSPSFNNEAGIKALEMLLKIVDAMGPEALSYNIDDLQIGLTTGRVGFANIWASRSVNMVNPEISPLYEELAFAPSVSFVEGGPISASAWNDFYCIPKNLEIDPELAFQVLMEAVDIESQMEAVNYGIPTRMKTLESDDIGPFMEATMTGLAEGVGAYRNTPAMPLVRSVLADTLPLVATGKYTPQEVLDMAEDRYMEEAKANGFLQ